MLEIRIGELRVEAYSAENPRYRSRMVLVHGLWTGAWCWRPFASFLAHRGWEVLVPALRGEQANRLRATSKVTWEQQVADLASLLGSSEIAAEPTGDRLAPVVIGHDVGAVLALQAAKRVPCTAVVALAPAFETALSAAYRRLLRSPRSWFRRELPPPRMLPEAPSANVPRLEPDSKRIAASLLRGGFRTEPMPIPVLVVAGSRDTLIDSRRLEREARAVGFDFAERSAGHWELEGSGFERQVDPLHRWLVKRLGPKMLRLTGYEDLDEEESP